MIAIYDGTCPECGYRIRADVDMIEPDPDGEGWRHVTCPDPAAAADVQAMKNATCGRCGLLHPGEC